MKKSYRIWLVMLSLFLVAAMLCGCGSSADSKNAAYEYGAEQTADNSASKTVKSDGSAELLTQNRKIIEYIDLTVETKNFDKLIDDINAAVKQSGGYIESSDIGGNSYYGTDSRRAELKIRIPKSKQSDFSDFMAENSNVVNRSVNSEDVTDQYVDTESRIKALTIEKETLEKLLEQTASVADTLTVYEKLTDVIAEIESYQGRLNQMDNLIDYTTFTVYISEVEKVTNVEKQSWFAKTLSRLSDNLSDIGNGFLSFLSFIIAGLPYWILVAVIVIAVILIVRISSRRRKKKLMQRQNKQ